MSGVREKEPNELQRKTYGDVIPIFVHHHHAKKHTKREEKQAINIVLDCITDRRAKREEQHLSTGEERCAEYDVANGPPVIEGAEDKDELGYDVDGDADKRPEEVDDEEGDGFGVVETKLLFESGDGDEEGDGKDEEAGYAEELCGAVG